MAEGVPKRHKAEQSFDLFKCNEFIDYMKQATKEDVWWWASYFATNGVWHWSNGDLWLRSTSNVIMFSRTVGIVGNLDDTRHPKYGAWLKKCDETLYQRIPRDILILLFQRVTSVEDIVNCSLVCKKWHQVSRMDLVYQRWINGCPLKRCKNPYDGAPLWKQFFFLSGQYSRQWYQWYRTRIECLFLYAILVYGRTVESPIYDYAETRIYDGSTGGTWLYQEDGRSYVLVDDLILFSPAMMRQTMSNLMCEQRSLC